MNEKYFIPQKNKYVTEIKEARYKSMADAVHIGGADINSNILLVYPIIYKYGKEQIDFMNRFYIIE